MFEERCLTCGNHLHDDGYVAVRPCPIASLTLFFFSLGGHIAATSARYWIPPRLASHQPVVHFPPHASNTLSAGKSLPSFLLRLGLPFADTVIASPPRRRLRLRHPGLWTRMTRTRTTTTPFLHPSAMQIQPTLPANSLPNHHPLNSSCVLVPYPTLAVHPAQTPGLPSPTLINVGRLALSPEDHTPQTTAPRSVMIARSNSFHSPLPSATLKPLYSTRRTILSQNPNGATVHPFPPTSLYFRLVAPPVLPPMDRKKAHRQYQRLARPLHARLLLLQNYPSLDLPLAFLHSHHGDAN